MQILLAAALALAPASTEPPVAGAEPAAAAMPAPPTQPADAAVARAPLPEATPTGTRPANPDEIVVTGEGAPRNDPAAAVNEVSFEAVQAVDKAIVGPISDGYVMATPRPLRQGVHNALNNLSEPINLVNSLLQFKVGRAFRALGRFGINSTLGVAGLFNFAEQKPFKLRYERNGFANTLGYYGIGAGPYMYLPLIGATSTRDLAGRLLDLSLVPAFAGPPFSSPAYATGTGIARSLDDRVEIDGFLRRLRSECSNPYAAEREYYLAIREAEIAALHGRPFDLQSRLPACLAEGPLVRVGQAVPPPAEQPEVKQAPAAPPQADQKPPETQTM